jgi:hypothetical protein
MDGQTGGLLDMLKGASDGDMKNEISLFKAQEFLRAYHRKSPQRGTPREIFLQTDTAAEYLDFLRDAAQDSGVTEVMERVIAGIAEKQEYQLLDKPMDMARTVYDRTIKGLAFAPAERFQQMVNQRLREASAQSGLPLPELS